MTSIDTTSLSVEDKKVNIGLVNGLRHKATVRQRGPNIDISTTQPHGMGTGDRIFVTNLNDIVGMAEGLYLVQTAVNSTYMELTNLDGTGIGASVGNFQPEVSFSGPHTDVARQQLWYDHPRQYRTLHGLGKSRPILARI